MVNKHVRPIQSTVVRNKLDALLKNLNQSFQNKSVNTQEDLIAELIQVVNSLYLTLRDPLFVPRKFLPGELPDRTEYNDIFSILADDIDVLFKELAQVEGIVLGNFNYIVTERDRLNKKIKSVASSLGDLTLFSQDPLNRLLFFKDSFNDVSKIDVNSRLLNNPQAQINQDEGVITLSVDRSGSPQTAKRNLSATINSGSNGQSGNNFQVGAQRRAEIRDILDGNADTWFEYERVQRTREENTNPLLLDLTLTFNVETIINFILINPNNFGTQNFVKIKTIDTSLDGNVFISIKDDIPIAGFLTEDEENVFTLAPSVSKFAGQGLYTFTPRKVKHIHLVFEQNTPLLISTPTGEQFRYAIGIRDIEAHAIPFETVAEVISTPFDVGTEIAKVSLLAAENPSEVSELADITHQISPDDGASWYDIQPLDRDGIEIPEVLNFNTGDEDSVVTAHPVTAIRHKAILTRRPEAFEDGSSTLRQTISKTQEIVNLGTVAPFEVAVTKPPVAGTITLLNPLFGSKGKDIPKRFLAFSAFESSQRYIIPFDGITLGSERIFVENVQWTRVGSFANSQAEDKHYTLNVDTKFLAFGDGINGKIPDQGARIEMGFDAERVSPNPAVPHRFDLQFHSDGDEKSTEIRLLQPAQAVLNEVLPRGAQVIRLKNKRIVDNASLKFFEKDASGVAISQAFVTQVDFIDGQEEFSGTPAGRWSINLDQGIVYTEAPTHKSGTATITYDYIPVRILKPSTDWKYSNIDNAEYRSIELTPGTFASAQGTADLAGDVGNKVASLDQIALVDKTVVFTEPDSSGILDPLAFQQEVKFIDGITELSNVVQVLSEIVPANSGGNGVTPALAFTLAHIPNLNFEPAFTNTSVFLTRKTFINGTTENTTSGDYSINPSTGAVWTRNSTGSVPGTVSYYFNDNTVDLTGYYSIDYYNGIVYTVVAIRTGTTAAFNFSNYEVSYNIARIVPTDRYTVDTQKKLISLASTEIQELFGRVVDQRTGPELLKVIYQFVDETRDSIKDLEPFFTPILKDYVIKVLTKANV